jgi:hypothetical protein
MLLSRRLLGRKSAGGYLHRHDHERFGLRLVTVGDYLG